MLDLQSLQTEVYQNKLDHGFNVENIDREFCFIHGELHEAFYAYLKGDGNVGEELADVAIYLLGISEILGIDLESEIMKKIDINRNRKYVNVNNAFVKEG